MGGDYLFIDKRDDGTFDFPRVRETATEPPNDDNGKTFINAPEPLSREAALVNQAYSQQVITDAMSRSGTRTRLRLWRKTPTCPRLGTSTGTFLWRTRRPSTRTWTLWCGRRLMRTSCAERRRRRLQSTRSTSTR